MTSPITALAFAVRDTIQDTSTPKTLRDRLIRFAAELRDILSPDAARLMDAIEAEVVILTFCDPVNRALLDVNNRQLLRQKLLALESRLADSE